VTGSETPAGALEIARHIAESAGAAIPAAGPLLAIGWATVDPERAIGQLANALHILPATFQAASGSIALGARCVVARAVLGQGISLLVMEPSTEGRLAAFLARFGEGPTAAWYEMAQAASATDGPVRPGPLGPERLVPGAPTHGPFRFLIESGRVPSLP
jgi:hypothetical protein